MGLLGGGVIGGGWAARFVLNGVDVDLYDPDPDAARKVGEVLDNARRAYDRLTDVPRSTEGALRFVGTPDEAVAGADFVQESAPERLALKQAMLAERQPGGRRVGRVRILDVGSAADRTATRHGASRTARRRSSVQPGLPPAARRGRRRYGDGRQHSIDRAVDVYRSIGMRPLVVRKEIDGFVADRLLEALWREALWLVNDGVATVSEIDDAIRFGAGLRWSFMGTFLTYRIAGGEAGMRHFMEQFGPALQWPWSKLTDVPELTGELIDRLVDESDDAGRRPVDPRARSIARRLPRRGHPGTAHHR